MAYALYKGVGPGTHWSVNNPKQAGGFSSPRPGAPDPAWAVQHIALAKSNQSPFTSFTTSFAIARGYALLGTSGPATQQAPGIVYELDPRLLVASGFVAQVQDPVHYISSAANGGFAHGHTGDGTLIESIAARLKPYSTAVQHTPRSRSYRMAVPPVSDELIAMIFAIRDAEVLVPGLVPASAIVGEHPVF